ncbi:TonB-dependent receptor [Sphingobium sufflavum]|uniref:TonB-dependent receptor plug domain-containing protein n=1 Tax=Sphingobium sufflavum TaxID=1129547 RepID=UPI001F3B087F|nr:TonB-dependent receptor [Sphingobium sufflavum]MCE7797632.1 TonB-dependent receptor [Sphingobium sufflavum]
MIVFATLLGTTMATPVLAAGAAGEAGLDSAAATDIVVTASRIPLEPRQVGSALTIVTGKELKRAQTLFIKDALQDLAGVQITSDRPGDQVNVSIRGSDNNQVLWMIDGVRMGDPSLISTEFQSDNMITADIGRVEVLRGNQSSLYGSDAIGGVINIVTQRATEDGIRLSAEAEGGSYGTVSGGASILGKSGPLDFRLTATGYSHDGPSAADPLTAPAGAATEQDRYWRYGLSGRVGLALTDTLSVQALGFWQKARTDFDNDSDFDNIPDDTNDVARKREYAVAVKADYLSLDKRLRADATISRFATNRLYFGPFNDPSVGDVFKGTKDAANVNVGYDGGIWSVALGGSLEREKTDQTTFFSGTFAQRIDTKAIYGEVALHPVENLTLTGAARVDDNSRFGTFDTYRGTIAYVVPGIGGADSVKFRASYGSGAKAPGLYQLFDPSFGNPNLKAQTSEGGDAGVDILFDRFTAQISYFFNRTKNKIGFEDLGGFNFKYAQFDRAREQGVEVAFTLKPVDGVEVNQSFTYLDAKKSDNGGLFVDIGRPRHSGSTAVTWTPVEPLTLTARARYRSRNANSFGGVTAPYAVVDLLAAYRVNDRIELYGRIVNLLDKPYQMTFGTNALDRAAYGGVRVRY